MSSKKLFKRKRTNLRVHVVLSFDQLASVNLNCTKVKVTLQDVKKQTDLSGGSLNSHNVAFSFVEHLDWHTNHRHPPALVGL